MSIYCFKVGTLFITFIHTNTKLQHIFEMDFQEGSY
jgi:hypothetical protein